MSKVLKFGPRELPSRGRGSPEEDYFNTVVRELQAMPSDQRISKIAAACADEDWKGIAELTVYLLSKPEST